MESQSGTTGYVRVELWFIPYTFASGGNCLWPSGRNENSPTAGAPTLLTTLNSYHSTGWWQRRTAYKRLPSNAGVVQLVLKNRTWRNGARAYVRIDNAALEVF